MNEYTIDTDIPIPESRMSANARKQPIRSEAGNFLSNLKVGDSFYVPADAGGIKDVLNKFYNPATRIGIRITVQKWQGGYRVWRIK